MENNLHPFGLGAPDHGPDDAQALLDGLAVDRAALAGRLAAPWWLYPAFGVTAALYVASPAIESDAIRNAVAALAVAFSVILVWRYQRLSGVKMSRIGAPGRITVGALVVAILVLLSTSLGLASFGLYWWIAVPTVVGFGLVVVLGRLFDRQYRARVQHGR